MAATVPSVVDTVGRYLRDHRQMATTSSRLLTLLSVLAIKGPDGGYQLGAGSKLPPLVLDDEQAIAVAVALRTAPISVSGIDDAVARALTSIKQIMPAHLRAEADAMHLTAIPNAWEFAAPPIASETLKAVGSALRRAHVLRFDYLDAGGRRPHPTDPDFCPPISVEPHHLVMWAGRWYLVAHLPGGDSWKTYRVERIHPHAATNTPFVRQGFPSPGVAEYVMTNYDRGDTPARWPCIGSVLMDVPAGVVARWAPGGSVVESVSDSQAKLTLGAWSWAGIAGLLATFDADITDIGPIELVDACRTIADRYARAVRD